MTATMEVGRARIRKAATWAGADIVSEMARLLAEEHPEATWSRIAEDEHWIVLTVEREVGVRIGGPLSP